MRFWILPLGLVAICAVTAAANPPVQHVHHKSSVKSKKAIKVSPKPVPTPTPEVMIPYVAPTPTPTPFGVSITIKGDGPHPDSSDESTAQSIPIESAPDWVKREMNVSRRTGRSVVLGGSGGQSTIGLSVSGHSSGSHGSHSDPNQRTQPVGSYTRRDGTHVGSYNRSPGHRH